MGIWWVYDDILERIVPPTLIYLGMTKPQMPNPEEREQKGTSFDYLCPCAFVEVQPLIYGPFLVSAWQLNTSQTNWSCVRERGRPGPKLQRWALFDSCFHLVIIPPSHSRIFGLPKVFLSLSPSSSPRFLFLSPGCDWLLWQSRHWAVSLF